MELIVKLYRGRYQWAVSGPEKTTQGDRDSLGAALKAAAGEWSRMLRESLFNADLEETPERVLVLYRDTSDWQDIRVFRDMEAFLKYAKEHTSWDTDADEFHHAMEALRAGENVVDRESVLFWTDLIEDGKH